MAFFPLPVEAKSLAHAICKFQYNTDNKKTSYIESILQKLVDCVAAIEPINFFLHNVVRTKIRAAASASFCFYNFSWLTNTDKFLEAIARFEELIADP